ncbi:hypothetical protein KAU32_00045 [bacterium]|nr:hypothetical protein [bacterium]
MKKIILLLLLLSFSNFIWSSDFEFSVGYNDNLVNDFETVESDYDDEYDWLEGLNLFDITGNVKKTFKNNKIALSVDYSIRLFKKELVSFEYGVPDEYGYDFYFVLIPKFEIRIFKNIFLGPQWVIRYFPNSDCNRFVPFIYPPDSFLNISFDIGLWSFYIGLPTAFSITYHYKKFDIGFRVEQFVIDLGGSYGPKGKIFLQYRYKCYVFKAFWQGHFGCRIGVEL